MELKEYLVERYAARHQASGFEREAARVEAAAENLARRGPRIRYLRSFFLLEEETCFHLFEAADEEAVEKAMRDAGLEWERIVLVLDSHVREGA
jgi:hypothetical protein